MGGTGKTLTLAEIVEINHRMVREFGGIFFEADNNLANPGSLEHVLEEIRGSLFGHEIYPTVFEKAADLSGESLKVISSTMEIKEPAWKCAGSFLLCTDMH